MIDGLPIDGLVTRKLDNKTEIYGYNAHGCMFHSHGTVCHEENPATSHTQNCHICLASKQKSRYKYRPFLWKKKSNSPNHPLKQSTHEMVAQQTSCIDQRLRTSTRLDHYMCIYSCELIPRWDQPLVELLHHLKLPVRSNISKTMTLGESFSACVLESFPLLGLKKITMESLVKSSRQNTLHGLIRVTGFCGREAKKILKNFKIFSTLNTEKKMINSNSIHKTLISSNFLHFLLDNTQNHSLKDFVLKDISEVFLWPKTNLKPYKPICDHITYLLSQNASDKGYCQILKNLSNMYCGQLSFSPNNHPITHILPYEEFQGLTQMKHLLSTENITQHAVLAHFKSHRSYSNAIQNHFLVIQESRLIYIKMLIRFMSFLTIEFSSGNCDGLLAISAEPLKTSGRGTGNDGIIAMDSCLKQSLTRQDLEDYVSLKNMYFERPQICPDHKEVYIDSLIKDQSFIPPPCCKEYTSNDKFAHKLKVEAFGNHAVVFDINKSCVFDKQTNTVMIKHSGSKIRNLETIFSKSPESLKQLFSVS